MLVLDSWVGTKTLEAYNSFYELTRRGFNFDNSCRLFHFGTTKLNKKVCVDCRMTGFLSSGEMALHMRFGLKDASQRALHAPSQLDTELETKKAADYDRLAVLFALCSSLAFVSITGFALLSPFKYSTFIFQYLSYGKFYPAIFETELTDVKYGLLIMIAISECLMSLFLLFGLKCIKRSIKSKSGTSLGFTASASNYSIIVESIPKDLKDASLFAHHFRAEFSNPVQHDTTGFAFVTFRHSWAVYRVLSVYEEIHTRNCLDIPNGQRRNCMTLTSSIILNACYPMTIVFSIGGNVIHVSRAPDPSDVLFENIGITQKAKAVRTFFITLYSLFLGTFSLNFLVVIFLTVLMSNQAYVDGKRMQHFTGSYFLSFHWYEQTTWFAADKKDQPELNFSRTPSVWPVAECMSSLMYLFMIGCIFSRIMPLTIPTLAIFFFLQYWVDKTAILRCYRDPPRFPWTC
ncbi:hypothetical protein BLNAU_22741 [Blattamonas nauphoetae]|uniref:CSC1/OSCA1-like 7TM region domain-containing protein n=1 Tax=Blattamonas nauphoetae TaxID=2049346 RepID=A0ABQ9WTB5_9EUKA|nr:hypothetical protein BLNAU_22741 [Blattamonas nauphoetae]